MGIKPVKPYKPPTFRKAMALSSVTPLPVLRSSRHRLTKERWGER